MCREVSEDPDVLATDEDDLKYDVILLHFRNDKPLDEEAKARANLRRFVEEGHGLVLIHFACGAFGDWPGFGELAGMVWDGKNTHDPRGPFDVHIANPRHPITAGLSDFRTDDELYIGLDRRRPVEVLATARSKVTGHDHPMAFAFPVGKGRVFHTPLGHDVKAGPGARRGIDPPGDSLGRGAIDDSPARRREEAPGCGYQKPVASPRIEAGRSAGGRPRARFNRATTGLPRRISRSRTRTMPPCSSSFVP